jgi:hypothetical protein
VSRQTISNYLAALEATFVAHVVRPFSSRRSTEIVAAPKVYGFDTGFVSYYRGWDTPRPDDLGSLWEHYVLNEVQGRLQRRDLRYWRNKHGAEVDFVLERRSGSVVGIEVKSAATASASDFNGLKILAEAAGSRFHRGIVLYTGTEIIPFGPRLHAIPIDGLWRWGAARAHR